jgi:hypothetical protein
MKAHPGSNLKLSNLATAARRGSPHTPTPSVSLGLSCAGAIATGRVLSHLYLLRTAPGGYCSRAFRPAAWGHSKNVRAWRLIISFQAVLAEHLACFFAQILQSDAGRHVPFQPHFFSYPIRKRI